MHKPQLPPLPTLTKQQKQKITIAATNLAAEIALIAFTVAMLKLTIAAWHTTGNIPLIPTTLLILTAPLIVESHRK